MSNTKKYVSLDKLGVYDEKIKKYLGDADATALQSAKDYADSLAENYDAAGSAATAESNAKAYADGKDAAIAEAKKAGTDAAAAAATADGKAVNAQNAADAAQADVDALELYVGTIPEGYTESNVVAYINKKAEETLNAASGGSSESAASVLQALNTYKAENDPKVNKNTEDIAKVQTAVDTEKSRAEGIEAGLRTDVDVIKGDYLKASDKTELQGNINTVSAAVERLTNGVSADEVDGVNDLIQYVKDHGTEVTGMQEDIAENAEAIEGVSRRMDTAEGKITAVEGAVATKAEQTYVDEQVEALQGVDTGLGNRITALEGKFGGAEGSVEDMIADAKQEAIDAAASAADTKDEAVLAAAKKYADDEDALIEARVATLETASATHALASDLTALDGRVETAEGEIDTLQTEMDAVEAKAAANESAIGTINTELAKKAAQTDLDAVSGRVTAIETWHANFVEVSEEEINALFENKAN